MRQLLLPFLLFLVGHLFGQDFMLQAWYWDYPSQNCGGLSTKWAPHLQAKASDLGSAGFTYVWLPPPAKGGSECSVGYDPKDLYDLGDFGATRLGSRAQLNSLISALESNGMLAVADVVYNHRDGGDWEDNPAVENYMNDYPNVGNPCNNGVTPYPVNGKVRWRLPLGGSTGNTAGQYYFKFSSASGGPGFYGRGYKLYFQTSQVGWQGLSDESETEPNGGGDCGTPNDQTSITLGRNMLATVDNPNIGECGVDEFLVDLQVGDFAAAGDYLEIYIEQTGGDGTGIDVRPYDLYAAPRGASIIAELDLQTRTDFTNLPSGQGPMNYLNFKPNGIDPTCLEGDWDFPFFFFDVEQRESTTSGVYEAWSEWLIEDAGFTGGLRMDAVKHFDPAMVTDLLNYLSSQGIEPGMIVGEIFDGSTSKLNGWVNDVNDGLTANVDVRAFDFNLRLALKDACDQHFFNFFYDARNVFNAGMQAAGADPFSVVTFVNNHDFRGPNEPVQDGPELAYAYILTNNKIGLPCVFYPDFFNETPPNYPVTDLQTEITELMEIHQQHIFGATDHYYLNAFGTSYASNYVSGNANQCLIYQISGGVGGKDVIVAINFDDENLQVNQEIDLTNVPLGAQIDDVLGNSEFPFAVVNNSGGVSNNMYISLPPRSYSVWVHNTSVAVPVELIDFTAQYNKGTADLKWSTAAEEDFRHFRIERSIDGTKFETLGTADGKGGAGAGATYGFVDASLPKGSTRIYYRLAMVDMDGSEEFSPIRTIRQPVNKPQFWPNPVADQLRYEHLPAGAQWSLYDVKGRLIRNGEFTNENGVLSTTDWENGVYQIRVTMDQEIFHSQRIVKTR
ncbi:MAG: T9SS type A sorting domain-containing protein [Bacteroidota bacterium]